MSNDFLGLPVARGRVPVLGHLPRVYGDQRAFFTSLAARGPLVWFDFGAGDWTLLHARPAAWELCQDPAATSSHVRRATGPIAGDSLIGLDGPDHRRVRGVLNRPFSPGGLRGAAAGELTASRIERTVSELAEGRVNLLDRMRELALEVIFGLLGVPASQHARWSSAYRSLLGGFVQIAGFLPGTPAWRAHRARTWLDDRLLAIVNEARGRTSDRPTLLETLARAEDDAGQVLSDAEVVDNLRLLVLAGHETSASVMTWVLLHLLHDPELVRRLRAEHAAAGDLPRSPQDLQQFPLASGVFREALRLHPPISFTQRTLDRPVELAGVEIPRGVKVTIPIEWISRCEAHTPRPDAFLPERWTDRALHAVERVQFGAGPHFCLGYHLAWLEITQLVVAFAAAALRPAKGLGTWPSSRYFPLLHPRRRQTWVRLAREEAEC